MATAWLGRSDFDALVYLFFPRSGSCYADRRRLDRQSRRGVVQMVTAAVPPTELGLGDEPLTRVAIFMNVFNVHVNRIPIDGTVEKIAYRPGLF